MEIGDVYRIMKRDNLTLDQAANLFNAARSTIRYHLIKFCKANALDLPKQKQGRKPINKQFSKKNDA